MMDLAFLYETFLTLITGLPLTLRLATVSIALGAGIALGLALLRLSRVMVFEWFVRGYVFVVRGTPLLVQMFLIYYGLGQFRPLLVEWGVWGFFREPYWCAITALTLNTAAYGSEIIRGGLQSVPYGQVEAARAHGMSGLVLFRRIIWPIAVRQALPAYGNEIILMVKGTALASIITMMEVTGLAHKIISETFRPFEVFVVAGSVYLALNFLITRVIYTIEWWLSPHLRDAPRVEADLEVAHVK